MSDLEKIEFLVKKIGKMKTFIELGYSSSQNLYRWRESGIPELAKIRVEKVLRKYKNLIENK